MPERDDAELGEQLRSYVDGVSTPVGAEQARMVAQRHIARRRRTVTGVIEAIAVAAVIGTIALAARGGSSSQGPAGTTVATIPETSTSCCSPITSGTTVPPTVAPTTPLTSIAPPASGTWNQLISGGGLWAFATAQTTPGGPRLAFLDAPTGHVLAQASGAAVPVDWTGAAVASGGRDYLYGVRRGGAAGASTIVVFTVDGHSIHVASQLPISEEPVAIAGNEHTVWVATAHSLRELRGGNGAVSIGNGPPIVDLAVDPTGRLYVLQADAQQQSLLSVRAADGGLLRTPRAVGSGPGPARIVAAANGVWVAQPTGTMGMLQRYSPDLVAQGASIQGSNGMAVRAAGNVVLAQGVATDGSLVCLDPVTGARRGAVPGSPGEEFATDGARVYQAPYNGGIEVHDLPASCRS